MSNNLYDDKEFDRWHDGLNKVVSAETGDTVKMSDPLNIPIAVLSAVEEFKSRSEPLVIEDALTNTQIEFKKVEPVIIEEHISGQVFEV